MKSSWVFAVGAVQIAAAQNMAFQSYPDCTNGLLATNGVCDTKLSPPARAKALVSAMNVQEKLQNLMRYVCPLPLPKTDRVLTLPSKGKGATRIGLPAYHWWGEALHGVAYAPGTQFRKGEGDFNSSTSFPMPLLMAAGFDDELIQKIGEVIGVEGRAFANKGWSAVDYWTPNVNPFRDPRWGRGSETPGEDVLRVKRYAASMVKGLEGPLPERRVIATCKHYAGNDFEDWGGKTRHDFNAELSLQDLAEYYMKPFQTCTRDIKVGSIMCAYNAVNGIPSCASDYLLNQVLRDHWNWTEHNNYITSDCEAVLDISLNHHYAKTNAEGTGIAFQNGMDLSCEYESSSDIPGAYAGGYLKEPVMDRALLRLYEGLVRAGYFDGDKSAYNKIGWADVNKPEAQKIALQSAVEGMVLLKNDGVLPLAIKPDTKLAMIGFWAEDGNKLSGGYSGTPAFKHHPAWAARDMGLNIITAGGPVMQTSAAADNWTAPALAAAKAADYILYFGGLDTTAAGETKDRQTVEWPASQVALLKALGALGKPLVVLQMGDQLDDTPLFAQPAINGLIWANWPGQDGGPAVMQLLTGKKAPAGRLPVTMYPSNYTTQVGVLDMTLRPSATSPGRTYRWYNTPVKPFGFGLHYTTFSASVDKGFPAKFDTATILKGCKAAYKDMCELPKLTVEVANTGKTVTSDYVALAFVAGEFGPKPYPIKTLASYTRVRDVKPGQKKKAKLTWTLGEIARHDEEGNTVLYPGKYTILIDEPTLATYEFEIVGEKLVLDLWPAPK